MDKKKILLLSTGGTIASVAGANGLRPEAKGEHFTKYLPERLKHKVEVTYKDILCLDSSNVRGYEWLHMAREILSLQEQYQAVVVTHGTDTMAYTASALCYLLMDCRIPVVITGSQKPIGAPKSDASRNIREAFYTAYYASFPLVMIVFHGKIMLGNHASKVNATSVDAFHSIYSEYVGKIHGSEVTWNEALIQKIVANKSDISYVGVTKKVFLLKLYPGISGGIFDWLRAQDYKGVLIEGFGCGGIPSMYGGFLDRIREMVEDGKLVVIKTQCYYGNTDMDVYEVGKMALRQGALCISNMTTEALLTKMMWAMDFNGISEARTVMQRNICGELTHVKDEE